LDPNGTSNFAGLTLTSSFNTSNSDVYASVRVIRNAGSANLDGMYIGYGNSSSGTTRIYGGGSTGNNVTIDASGNLVASGNVTAYSDRKLKTNIQTIKNALKTISKLRGVTFDWIESGQKSVGMIAQEVEEIIPELITESEVKGPEDKEPTDVIKSLDYSKMVAILIEAIKEQQERIEALEEKLNGN
jgi:hypothetical protein